MSSTVKKVKCSLHSIHWMCAASICLISLLLSFPANAQLQGQAYLDSLIRILPTQDEDTSKVTLLNEISFNYYSIDPNQGIKYGLNALELATRIGWKRGIMKSYTNLGVNYDNKADYPKALDYYFKALKINEELNDPSAIAKSMVFIGIIYDEQKNCSEALEYYSSAAKIFQKLGDKHNLAVDYGDIALVYRYMGNFLEAIKYDSLALQMFEDIGDQNGIARTIGNMGIVYQNLKEYSKAFEYDVNALQKYRESDNKYGISLTLGSIGDTYLWRALDSAQKNSKGVSKSTREKESFLNAAKYYDSSIMIAKEAGYLDLIISTGLSLSLTYEKLGRYKEALTVHQQIDTLRDSVFSTENKIKITNLETARAIELKNKQIEIDKLEVAKKRNERVFFIAGLVLLLTVIVIVFRNYKRQKIQNKLLTVEKQKVEERTEELKIVNNNLNITLETLQETQEQLVKTEKQKENEMIRTRISQDIHDDISSELTKISWVSELAKAKAKKVNSADVVALLEKITTSSRETVTKLGEIIWTVNPRNDSLGSLLAYMRNYIAKFLTDTPFHYSIDFPDTNVSMLINPELKRNLFLTLKEALNNAVKYSQAKNIVVTFTANGDNYFLAIADDGRGIEENVVHGGGNGLGNMNKRMNAIKGTCKITSATGKGTKIELSGILY